MTIGGIGPIPVWMALCLKMPSEGYHKKDHSLTRRKVQEITTVQKYGNQSIKYIREVLIYL